MTPEDAKWTATQGAWYGSGHPGTLPNSAVKHPAYIPTAEAGCFTAEFGKAFESLCDSMLPSHPPLGLDFGTIGFQSKQSPDQNVTSLDRTQQQAVTCRL